MDLGSLIQLMRSAIITMITVASPVLIVAMGVGLIVSIFQATTSIQDQTLT
ncbi:MAG: EscS/YscS/HrcS family type III secretion system export apparatus protein, partial [Spirochaetes bacterium]